MLIFFAARAGAYTIPYEMWMGTFIGEKKVGWMSLNIEGSDYGGVKGYKLTTVVNNHLTVLGADMTQLVMTTVYTDLNYAPLAEEFSMSSGGKTTTVKSKFAKTSVECEISAGSGASAKSVPIPDGVSLIADPLFTTSDVFPEVGKEYNMHYFNPLTLALEDLKIKVDKREKLTVGGRDYDTILLQNITPMGTMLVWQEADGAVVQVRGVMDITMTRMSRRDATDDSDDTGAGDLARLTSAKSDKPIENPREVKYLDAILVGTSAPEMLITDSRQKASAADRPDTASFKITATRFNAAHAAELPIKAPALKEFLAPTPYVDCDAKSISTAAKEIVGTEKNSYRACSKIRAWIYGNLRTKADIGITRSGSDVLKSKVGVCRDYAILFASLARAAKIPSKVVSGLIYTDGAFYYHAWVECYVGKWVPFDATLASDFVDATHVKLAEGDATTMFSLAKVIGSLRVEVISCQ